ncbi:MAG: fumarylacetoacetate hydrolase family protein [Acidimicrobiia bacterium]|nr:fumarylacetoacetate hydrolase family protein [Acidimicrobiia bacterium]
MTAHELIERAAAQLRAAAESGQTCSPVRDIVGTSTDVDTGYAIQDENTRLAIDGGRRVAGRKIGITSPAVMEQIGVDQPDFGTLFADMEFGDGVPIPAQRLLQPRAEAEVALVLEHDLDKGEHGFADIISATAYALPSIEVVDSRIADWDITIVDTVADNASCGLYVLGGRPVPLDRVDLRTIPMSMSVNETEVSTGGGAACLGHPLNAARWLADTMCARGTPLRAGDVVMTGALGPMRPMATGDRLTATFGDLGSVTTSIEP